MSAATTVSGTGTVKAPYDLVNFECSIHDVDESGPKAKEKLAESIRRLTAYYEELAAEGHTLNKTSSMSVQPLMVWDDGDQKFRLLGRNERTVLAVGPGWVEEIDKITGKLPLL